MAQEYPFYLAGRWERSDEMLAVTNPFNDEVVGTTYLASPEHLEEAIQAAERAFLELGRMAAYERADALARIAEGVRRKREELARLITLESGKPIRDALAEVDRGAFTLQVASEEAKRIGGEIIPLDLLPTSKGRIGFARRFPLGPVSGIYPFNFPLNLALHKLAPAIAAGNPIVLKPPSKTPLTMLMVAQLIAETALPAGAVSILPMGHDLGERLATDERFKLFSFTGSAPVGWAMKTKAGKKRVILELGGNAGVIVDDDADLAYAAKRITVGSFSYAGQVCISVQRVYIHESVFSELSERLVAEARGIRLGDPLDPATDLGPMIDDDVVERTEEWVHRAVQGGARVLCGGRAQGRFFEPTILVDADPASEVCRQEVFAPLVNLFPFQDFRDAILAVNDSAYGLQAGVFTQRLDHALTAFEGLEVGGVIINDVPTYRIDHMPYGGEKDSGFGREGLRYAIEEMTQLRLMAVNRLG